MPRFLLALTVTLTALTFALALTARAWGETQPPHPALRGFVDGCEGKPQPCWYGITTRPSNLVSLEIAESYLIQEGYLDVYDGVTLDERQYPYRVYQQSDAPQTCDANLTYQPVTQEVIYVGLNCNGKSLRIGDLLLIWGAPDYLNPDPYPFFLYETQSALVNIGSSLNLLSPLLTIALPTNYGGPLFKWHGVVPAWRICQLDEMPCSGGY